MQHYGVLLNVIRHLCNCFYTKSKPYYPESDKKIIHSCKLQCLLKQSYFSNTLLPNSFPFSALLFPSNTMREERTPTGSSYQVCPKEKSSSFPLLLSPQQILQFSQIQCLLQTKFYQESAWGYKWKEKTQQLITCFEHQPSLASPAAVSSQSVLWSPSHSYRASSGLPEKQPLHQSLYLKNNPLSPQTRSDQQEKERKSTALHLSCQK